MLISKLQCISMYSNAVPKADYASASLPMVFARKVTIGASGSLWLLPYAGAAGERRVGPSHSGRTKGDFQHLSCGAAPWRALRPS